MRRRCRHGLETRIARVENGLLPALMQHPEIGWTDGTEMLIEIMFPTIVEAGRENLREKVREVEAWLEWAKPSCS